MREKSVQNIGSGKTTMSYQKDRRSLGYNATGVLTSIVSAGSTSFFGVHQIEISTII